MGDVRKAINRACMEPTLIDAQAYIAVWEMERIKTIIRSGNVHPDSAFRYLFTEVKKEFKPIGW